MQHNLIWQIEIDVWIEASYIQVFLVCFFFPYSETFWSFFWSLHVCCESIYPLTQNCLVRGILHRLQSQQFKNCSIFVAMVQLYRQRKLQGADVSWEQVKVRMAKREVICKARAAVCVRDPTQQAQSCFSLLTIFMQALLMAFHSCWSVQVPCKNLSPAMDAALQTAQWKFRPEDKLQPPNIIKFTLLRYICRAISWFHRPPTENLCHNLTCLSYTELFWIFPELFPFPQRGMRKEMP